MSRLCHKSCAPSDRNPQMTPNYTGNIFVTFFSTVMELVCAEIAALSKFQVTKNAFSGLFPSVYLIMDSEITFIWLVLTTLCAFIKLHGF